MAAETDSVSEFAKDRAVWLRQLKGSLFEVLLIVATLVGVLALLVLFVLIGIDALGPSAADPAWYLLYFATLVTPVSAYTLYVRHDPAVAHVNARAFAVFCGGLALALIAYAVPAALNPYDVAIHAVFAAAPPLVVVAYGRLYGETHLTGPAVPVSVAVGLVCSFVLLGPLNAFTESLPDWVAYFAITTLPVAGILGVLGNRIWTDRGLTTAAFVVAAGLVTVGVSQSRGVDPSLWLVLVSVFLAPVALLVVETFERHPQGRAGLLGPVVLFGGILLGAWIEGQFGITGLDAWLRPTLVLESWSGYRPEQAGIYPQLLGSIMIVSLMTLMAFPVGVGAAVYLEEYAPATGWLGRLASVLDVNISNLAGVPSVVYGLLGLALFRQGLGLTPGILIAAATTLALLILPIMIVSAQEALRSVPDEYRQGSYGMGASRWQTIRNIVLPEAVPGILTGTILAIGRAIGETAPLVMIALATTRFDPPSGLFSGATALPLQIFAAKGNNIPEYRTGVVAAASIVLLALLLLMNATAILIRNRYQND
ncbi:phosphate ABC transporter permease PtsA [Halobacteriales archaeon QH_10_67_22]|nr:MAG: phosphate ABC transporter permease PtsA [Halobacteriales archaeon QH_10_67_22]